ncbi:MAG: AAA family ATPase [Anaerolineae bacterium]|nr:AAA family ATPase [Anaerolineae bacterium]
MRYDRFTERAQDAAMRAQEILLRYSHNQIDVEHLLLALLEQPDGVVSQMMDKLGADIEMIKRRIDEILRVSPKAAIYGGGAGQMFITPRVKRVFDRANKEASDLKDEYISTEHIFLAIASERGTPTDRLLRDNGVTKQRIYDAIEEIRGGKRITTPRAETQFRTLEKYSRDLTQFAREGKLDPVIGRDTEILRVIQVLSRRTKNNPVLIGEAGVGKTAIVEGLAQKIATEDVPEILSGKRVVQLDLGSMVAGSRFRGDFEERLKGTIEEIQQSQGEIILFIDEIHTVVGAGSASGALDAGNMLKPALARGELQCVGATTLDEYRKYIEKDSALERRFAPVYVGEPSVEEAIQMLRGLRDRYEAHHKVRFTDEALVSAAQLSHRYVTGRRLPDKAIDLIDEAAAKLRIAIYEMPPDLKEKKKELQRLATEEQAAGADRDYARAAEFKSQRLQLEDEFASERDAWQMEMNLDEYVEKADIAEVIQTWTGIPVSSMLETEAEKLLHMEDRLRERIVGQDEGIQAVSNAIRRARSGLKDPRRPIGSFIFLGSSGVGKTEMAKVLAEFMFGDDEALLTIDMSDYQERHTVSRLSGAPPGYVGYEEGGQLTEAVRRRPYQVVLFDEIEKAHPDVWNSLLQILEEGRLTDGQGHVVDFRNTVLIMTSNIGTSFAPTGGTLGFVRPDESATDTEDLLRKEISNKLKRTFRPEFLNRLDEVIIFHNLTAEHMLQIVDMQMKEVGGRLHEQGAQITLTDAAREWLADKGYDPQFGARPLRRALQRYIENPLSIKLLSGELQTSLIVADIEEDEMVFRPADQVMFEEAAAEQEPAEQPLT